MCFGFICFLLKFFVIYYVIMGFLLVYLLILNLSCFFCKIEIIFNSLMFGDWVNNISF